MLPVSAQFLKGGEGEAVCPLLCCVTRKQTCVRHIEDTSCLQTEALTDTQHLPQIHGWLPGGRWNLTLSATPCVRTQTDLMSDFFIYMCILFGVKPLSAEIDVCLLILLLNSLKNH